MCNKKHTHVHGNNRYSIKDLDNHAESKGGRCLSTKYTNDGEKYHWQCKCGFKWWTTWNSIHCNGSWCRRCAGLEKGKIGPLHAHAKKKGGRCLSKKYVDISERYHWQCKCGFKWWASWRNVKHQDTWCPECSKSMVNDLTRVSEKTAKKNVKARGFELLKYGGSSGSNESVFRCPKGHEWTTSHDKIVNQKTGCPDCVRSTSEAEKCWLDIEGISEEYRQYIIPESKNRKVDGYDPETNTIYQFHGDYWHGNPKNPRYSSPDMVHPTSGKTMKELYERTLRLDNELVEAGYTVVYIWESVFEEWYGDYFEDWKAGRAAKWGEWS